MRKETAARYHAFLANQARLNGVPTVTESFAVEPSVAQRLEDKVRESTAFLSLINTIPVTEMKGEVLRLGVKGPSARRTNTTIHDRTPRDPTEMDKRVYECNKVEHDTYITYQTMDTWAKFPDFEARVRNQSVEQIAHDRLITGWHGKTSADETDPTANPLLQDLNRGWLQGLRDEAPERVYAGEVIIGKTHRTLDQVVFEGRSSLLDPWHRNSTDLVAVIGNDLLTDKYLALLGHAEAPTEAAAIANLLLNKTIGGLRPMVVPYFPENAILITSPKNLSFYYQSGSHRRTVTDNPKRDRIEDYFSVNEAFVIEDLGCACLIEGITVAETAPENP